MKRHQDHHEQRADGGYAQNHMQEDRGPCGKGAEPEQVLRIHLHAGMRRVLALKVKVWAQVAALAEAVWAAEPPAPPPLPTPAPARVSADTNQVRHVTLPAVTWKTECGSGNAQ